MAPSLPHSTSKSLHFIVINDKAVKVSTDSVKSIIAEAESATLMERLLAAGVPYGNKSPLLRDIDNLPDSPFQHMLDWDYNRSGTKTIPLSAIEQIFRYVRIVFSFLEQDEESLFEIVCAVWRGVKVSYPELWINNEKFTSKVSMNALNEFLVDRLKFAWDISILDLLNPSSVEIQVSAILRLLPQIYWETKWSIKLQDNTNFRNLIKEDLATLSENAKLRQEWNTGLKLPLTNELEGGSE